MRLRSALLLALVATSAATAQSPKKAWILSVEERIALRTDPALARERVREDRRLQPQSRSTNPEMQEWVDSFNGKTHPELFLPYQVFDGFIRMAFLSSPRSRQFVREGLIPEVRQHGLPVDFWDRLEGLSAAYVADSWAVRDLITMAGKLSGAAGKRTEAQLELKYTDQCRSRADALAAARTEFGRERFDRFLYEVMAAKMFYAADKLMDPAVLRNLEEGCR